jgi:hypothetical protein
LRKNRKKSLSCTHVAPALNHLNSPRRYFLFLRQLFLPSVMVWPRTLCNKWLTFLDFLFFNIQFREDIKSVLFYQSRIRFVFNKNAETTSSPSLIGTNRDSSKGTTNELIFILKWTHLIIHKLD